MVSMLSVSMQILHNVIFDALIDLLQFHVIVVISDSSINRCSLFTPFRE